MNGEEKSRRTKLNNDDNDDDEDDDDGDDRLHEGKVKPEETAYSNNFKSCLD